MCADEGKGAKEIADYINGLGIPTRFTFSESVQRRKRPGKRLQNNAPRWRPSRILRMIHSTLYKGYRTYGERATLKDYEPILQQVPSIVDEELWDKANKAAARQDWYGDTYRRRQVAFPSAGTGSDTKTSC